VTIQLPPELRLSSRAAEWHGGHVTGFSSKFITGEMVRTKYYKTSVFLRLYVIRKPVGP